MKRLVLIDGNALLHRAYHAVPPLTTSAGELVNAVYGFTTMLLRTFEQLKPDYAAVCWDRRAPTFRHIDYVGYKANRKKMDDGLASQFERAREITAAMNIPSFGIDGYEADDCIGTLATQAAHTKSVETIIVTGDRDALQLISEQVKVFMPKSSLSDTLLYNAAFFEEKYGFPPKYLVDFKALAGDPSDNIPGVRGIGEVSATKLIKEYGSIESIYGNLGKITPAIAEKLASDAEAAVLSKKLATIALDAPISLDLSACTLNDYDKEKAIELFLQLEFKSLIHRLPKSTQTAPSLSQTSLLEQNSEAATMSSQDETLLPVLKDMQARGVLIDREMLRVLNLEIEKRLTILKESIYTTCGHEFNLNSPKQLARVLFDELHLPVTKKIKTGRSTDESVLHELIGAHPCVELLVMYRELFKVKSTYIEAWERFIVQDGRIHSTFRAGGAVTGRLSSSGPNLQNIPIKGGWGIKIRKAVIAPKGSVLLSADYSQIDLRVMAHIASDPGLKKAFQEGQDIHTLTASRIFEVEPKVVTPAMRREAKTIVFGLMYGMGPRSLAQNLTRNRESGGAKVDLQTAQAFLTRYFEEFPGVKAYMQHTIEEARSSGYVETMLGRKRMIPELTAKDARIRASGERMAINFPIQGTAADIINEAMVVISHKLQEEGLKSALVLQVHDELLFECPEREVKKLAHLAKEHMEQTIHLTVPLVVDISVGQNWGEMAPLQ